MCVEINTFILKLNLTIVSLFVKFIHYFYLMMCMCEKERERDRQSDREIEREKMVLHHMCAFPIEDKFWSGRPYELLNVVM